MKLVIEPMSLDEIMSYHSEGRNQDWGVWLRLPATAPPTDVEYAACKLTGSGASPFGSHRKYRVTVEELP